MVINEAILEAKLMESARLEVEVLEAIASLPGGQATMSVLRKLLPYPEDTLRNCLMRQKGICLKKVDCHTWRISEKPEEGEPETEASRFLADAPPGRQVFPALLEEYICEQTGALSTFSCPDRLLLQFPFDNRLQPGDYIRFERRMGKAQYKQTSLKVLDAEWLGDKWRVSTGKTKTIRYRIYPEHILSKSVELTQDTDLSGGLIDSFEAIKSVTTKQAAGQRGAILKILRHEIPDVSDEHLILLETWWNSALFKKADMVRDFVQKQNWDGVCIAQRQHQINANFKEVRACLKMLYHPNFKELQK